jgi:hypothetical protein
MPGYKTIEIVFYGETNEANDRIGLAINCSVPLPEIRESHKGSQGR